MSHVELLVERRFWPLFWTQFAGAFNDNLFRSALVVLVLYRGEPVLGLSPAQVVAAAGGLFILPFFLFSATAGQLTDRSDKARLVRIVKLAEIVIMGLAAAALLADRFDLLLFVLVLMGLQSAIFGPAKYGMLPQLLDDARLTAGNALISTATFLAILFGTIAGGLLAGAGAAGIPPLAAALVAVAVAGWTCSRFLPSLPIQAKGLHVDRNPFTPTLQVMRLVRRRRTVFLSVLGISWLWFVGAALLSLVPIYGKDVLHGGESLTTFLLALFSLGVGAGAMACAWLSQDRVELGLVPVGSFGMSLFALDLGLIGAPWPAPDGGELLGLAGFLAQPHALRISADLFLLAASAGMFVVPLQALIQQRSSPDTRSRVIAGNNILNALFMVAAAGCLMAANAAGLTIPQTVLLLAAANVIVAGYIYTVIPEFLFRFVAWVLSNILYRVREVGIEKVPARGPAVLVANHVTFVDWLLLGGACRRPARFVMHRAYFDVPFLRGLLRHAKVIPIASAREDPALLEQAFERIAAALAAGEIVCLFPEGRLSPDGGLQPFRPGVERIVARTPVPVIPIALRGLWGSLFSRLPGSRWRRFPWKLRAPIEVVVGEPVAPDQVTAAGLEAAVRELLGERPVVEAAVATVTEGG